MCLTAIVFLPEKIREIISQGVISPLKKTNHKQYFFPPDSLHITIKNIRTISHPPQFNEQDIEKTIKVFSQVIPHHHAINFRFQGLLELPTSLGVRGFSNETLKDLVLDLDNQLTHAGVPDNKKYASNKIFFSNTTICRYTSQPNSSFTDIIKELKNEFFGEFTANEVCLITTNAVCHPDKTTIIEKYYLNKYAERCQSPCHTTRQGLNPTIRWGKWVALAPR